MKREVFVLVEFEQMTVFEIAEIIGANLIIVYVRLRDARREIQEVAKRYHSIERKGRQ